MDRCAYHTHFRKGWDASLTSSCKSFLRRYLTSHWGEILILLGLAYYTCPADLDITEISSIPSPITELSPELPVR